MGRKRTSMRKTREILRLSFEQKLSQRKIASALEIGKTTVQDVISRAKELELQWLDIKEIKEPQLIECLFPALEKKGSDRPLPDWPEIKRELCKKSMTLQLLWMEYKEEHLNGYGYSQFCEKYREWDKLRSLTMRQSYKAGEKVFVDFSGLKIPWYDEDDDCVKYAELFVGVLGASNYTFAYAVESQSLSSWILCHNKMFSFYGGVSEIVVPDNLKAGVSKPCRYEPEENPLYGKLAEHYGTAIIPARSRKPRDKAKAETGVQISQRWICMRLRKMTFTSIAQINRAIEPLLEDLNSRIMKDYKATRLEMFQKYEKPVLRALPLTSFEMSEWKKCKVGPDYHIEVDNHYYSVPFSYTRKVVEVSYTRNKVEVFHKDERIAIHCRNYKKGKHTTINEHMPPKHQKHIEWTPERIINWASKTGSATKEVCDRIIKSRRHPQQGFRACLGIIRLGDKYSKERVENACRYGLSLGSPTYKNIQIILQNKTDLNNVVPSEQPKPTNLPNHENIRGGVYYV